MVGDHRESYTSDGVKKMKWGLAREAIGRDILQIVFDHESPVCFRGNLDEGYQISYDHDAQVHDQEYEPNHGDLPSSVTHYILPPVPASPGHGDGTVYLEDYRGNRKPTSFDVWGEHKPSKTLDMQGYYKKWSARVDRAFEGWDQVNKIPDERYFWEAAQQVRDIVKPLGSMALVGGSYYLGCHHLGIVENDPGMVDSPTPQERMWAPQINGPIDFFVIPVQGTFLNVLVLGEMLAAQLDGMGKMWQSARASVMDIGWNATKAMADHKAGIDVEVVIKGAGWVFGALGLVAMPEVAAIGVSIGGLVLSAAQEVLDAFKDKEPVDRESLLGGHTAEDVLRAVEKVLNADETNSLEPQIQKDESDAMDVLGTAKGHLNSHTIYDAVAKHYKAWYVPVADDVLQDSSPGKPADVDIDVEFQRLRNAGTVFADDLAKELSDIAGGVKGLCSSSTAWERPGVPGSQTGIGIGVTGPWEEWCAVRDGMAGILGKTATQVEDLGEYLIATANFLERQDETAKAAFDKIHQQLGEDF